MRALAPSQRAAGPGPIPATAGIGLRSRHHRELMTGPSIGGWLEAHTENYFAEAGPARAALARLAERYPISLHGVGLSLGSCDPLDTEHLRRLARLERSISPALISEHLSWSSFGGRHANDLLPLPTTEEALRHVARRVRAVQDSLGRQLLVENLSSYLQYRCSELSEPEFLAALVMETGCGLLLDVNNVYVNAMNHGFDPQRYLVQIPRHAVKEMHLAGHSTLHTDSGHVLRIDTHGSRVCEPVWDLYAFAIGRFGVMPTLIEWDTDVPELALLRDEAAIANRILEAAHARAA